LKTIFARKLTRHGAEVFEILPFVFYVPSYQGPLEKLERSNLVVQLSVPLHMWEIERLTVSDETFEFNIDESVFASLYLEIADLIGFTRASSHGHDNVTDPIYIAALLAASTQRRSKTNLGADLFEESRQLFLDLEVGQVNDYPSEIVLGELQAAWLYYSLFSEIKGFYRRVKILDLENWGVRGWSINVLRFVERSLAKNFTTGLMPTLSAREATARLFWGMPDRGDDSLLKSELKFSRRLSTHSSARILQIAVLNQYLRANNWDRPDYHNVVRAWLSEALAVQTEERGLTFETIGHGPVSAFGEFSSSLARSRVILSTFEVNFDLLPNPFNFFRDCMNWRENPSIDELVMAGVWNLHLVAQGVQEFDVELFRAIAEDFPSGENYDYFVKWSTYNSQLANVARLEREVTPIDVVQAAYEVFWNDYLEALKISKEQEGGFCFDFLGNLTDLEFLGAAFFALAAQEGHQHNPKGLEDFSLLKHFYEGSKYRPALSGLKNQFSAFGLSLPSLPHTLLRRLKKHRAWSWSSAPEREPLADYFFKFRGNPIPEKEDLLSISWAGHGLNSYALSINLKLGPIHILLKNYMGGVYGDPQVQTKDWNDLISSFEPLLSEISRGHFPHYACETRLWVQRDMVIELVDGEYSMLKFSSSSDLIDFVFERLTDS
jgi:hypothetical protein